MPIVLPVPTYDIRRSDDGRWEVRLQGKVIERHDTQQKAIEAAKRRAAQEGAEVEWEDPKWGKQGPVRPSKFGVYSETPD